MNPPVLEPTECLPWCCEGGKHTLPFREPVVSSGRKDHNEHAADTKGVESQDWKIKSPLLFPGTNLAR